MSHGPEVDALAEVVHLVEVLAPPLVDDPEQYLAFHLAHGFRPELGLPALEDGQPVSHQCVSQLGRTPHDSQVLDGQTQRPVRVDLDP